MNKNVYWSSRIKYRLFLSDFNKNLMFWAHFRKIFMSDFTKIRPVGAELFHADRRTVMTQLIVAFRNFAIAPKNVFGPRCK